MFDIATPVWDEITRFADRNSRPGLLAEAVEEGILPYVEYAAAVANAWHLAEAPETEYGIDFWASHFSWAGFRHDGEQADRPDSPLTLYRGAASGRERRMSWTDDLDTARWFAARVVDDGGSGLVIRARVQPWRLLAYIHESGRNESEWVIDPRRLRLELVESSRSTPALPSFEEMRRRRLKPASASEASN